MPKEIAGKRYYTVMEAGKALQVTPQTIRTWIKRGRLQAYRIGVPLYIPEQSLKQFIASAIVPTSINITLQK
jgi:excisionase family DNA binding protein